MTAETNELTVTRLIQAPPETVYRVFTTRTTEFFTPPPWKTPVAELDLRPGGKFRTVMEGPAGERMDSTGVFLEVVPGAKLVFTDGFGPGWVPQTAFMVAILTFEAEAGGTRYTATVRHWTAEACKQHEEMGFHQGWSIVAGQLAALAEAETAAHV
ncbi:MAG TPA: SRPBCC domain-containing protein [Azospirillaceae bacterium]|nr:SRPBCC domain-containing protein [Azospirillaceae bacterium]